MVHEALDNFFHRLAENFAEQIPARYFRANDPFEAYLLVRRIENARKRSLTRDAATGRVDSTYFIWNWFLSFCMLLILRSVGRNGEN